MAPISEERSRSPEAPRGPSCAGPSAGPARPGVRSLEPADRRAAGTRTPPRYRSTLPVGLAVWAAVLAVFLLSILGYRRLETRVAELAVLAQEGTLDRSRMELEIEDLDGRLDRLKQDVTMFTVSVERAESEAQALPVRAAPVRSPGTRKVYYLVQEGDDLLEIGARFEVPLSQLCLGNGRGPTDPLPPGTVLVLYTDRLAVGPPPRESAAGPPSGSRIALSSPAPGPLPLRSPAPVPAEQVSPAETVGPPPSPGPGSPEGKNAYRVLPGDTLFRIGLAHGIRWQEIARLNSLQDPSSIVAGQLLSIP